MKPFRLPPSVREKIWGATALEPWFPAASKPVGEVWFTFDENVTEDGVSLGDLVRRHSQELLGQAPAPDRFPILTKFIFTSERLSIQVHPDDEYAWRHEGSPGKTEMWHVLRAAPGARIAAGFRERIGRAQLKEAALSGRIEDLVRWFSVREGDTIFVPPGTVHAIGGGVALCEIQQNSDITYRLYDYGRPRELHLEKAVEVADTGPHPGVSAPVPLGAGRLLLAQSAYFATELCEAAAGFEYDCGGRMHVLTVIAGSGRLGGTATRAGDVWVVPASAPRVRIEPEPVLRLLDASVPGQPVLAKNVRR